MLYGGRNYFLAAMMSLSFYVGTNWEVKVDHTVSFSCFTDTVFEVELLLH